MKNYLALLWIFCFAFTIAAQDNINYNGYSYKVITINGNDWMGENLRTITYNDGSPIAAYDHEEDWKLLTEGGYALSDAYDDFMNDYGLLYNAYAVQTGNLCPDGWHVPTAEQWQNLIATLDANANGNFNNLGNQLKSTRQVNRPPGNVPAQPRWDEHPSRHGTDEHGFAALPAGAVDKSGEFIKMGTYAYFWTSTMQDDLMAVAQVMLHQHKGVSTAAYPMEVGFSVRCIKSDDTTPPPATSFSLTITQLGEGSTVPTQGTHDYEEGTSVDLSATPGEGWEFEKWVIDGNDITDATTNITMNDDVTAVAHFTEIILPPAQYTLTISSDGSGSTTPAAGTYDYEEGTSVDLSATPGEGWEFEKWVIDGNDITDATTNITMNDDVTAVAHFVEETGGDELPSVVVDGITVFVNTEDHTSSAQWGGFLTTTGATSESDGFNNTQTITNVLGEFGGIPYAAKVCQDLNAHGFNDWYLPAKDEMQVIFDNKDDIGGFGTGWYWSSTEASSTNAIRFRFDSGFSNVSGKNQSFNFRCVRQDN